VDASFIAAFNASGVTQKPDISGRMTLTSTGEFDTLQGSIRNDSLLTLTSPVVLARGIALYLENAIEPGDIVTVNSNDMTLTGESAPAPSSLEYAEGDPNPFATVSSFGFRRGTGSYESESIRSAVDILGADNYKTFDFSVSFKDDDATQEIRRRQAFLDSFMVDQFSSTARGNHVYLAGWVDSVPTTEEVEGAGFKTVDTTLYIIELEVERQLIGEDTLITGDQFTWISRERTGVSDIGPINMSFPSNSTIILRFTPLPDARLSNVTGMTLVMEGIRNAIFDEFEEYIEMWNWADEEWQRVGSIGEIDRVRVIRPQRYIGPQNSVEIRVIHGSVGGSLFIEKLAIEQSGEF
jgi:hypothetical protein